MLDDTDLKAGVHLAPKEPASDLPLPDAHHPNHRHVLQRVGYQAAAHDGCFHIGRPLVLRRVPARKAMPLRQKRLTQTRH